MFSQISFIKSRKKKEINSGYLLSLASFYIKPEVKGTQQESDVPVFLNHQP